MSIQRDDPQRKEANEVKFKRAFLHVLHHDFGNVSLRREPIKFELANELKEKLKQEKGLEDEHGDHNSFSLIGLKCVSKADQGCIKVG